MKSPSSDRINVFISYSHQDEAHLRQLKKSLAPYINGDIQQWLWDDTQIHAGERWKNQIDAALEQANAAILLVSDDFLASDFIKQNELPPLLDAADQKGTSIVPVILSPCGFDDVKSLSGFQTANIPSSDTLSSKLTEHEQKLWWTEVARNINKAIQKRRANLSMLSPDPPLSPSPSLPGTGSPSAIAKVNQNIIDFVESKATLFAGLFLSSLGIPLLVMSFPLESTLLTTVSAVVIVIGLLWFVVILILSRQKP